MLFFLITSWVLALAALTIGEGLRRRFSGLMEVAETFQLSFCAGLSLLCASVLLFSVAFPTRYFGIVVVMAVAFRWRDAKSIMGELKRHLSPAWLFVFLIIQGVLAYIMLPLSAYYDGGLYHLQMTDWFRDYGAVRGLALVHIRLGYVSAWYPLQGALEMGHWVHRASTLLNFVLFSAAAAFSLALVKKAAAGKTSRCDLFWLTGFWGAAAMLPDVSHSAAADLGVAYLVTSACWATLVCGGAARRLTRRAAAPIAATALLVATGAASLKASGTFLPVLLAPALFVVLGRALWDQKWVLLAALLPLAGTSAVSLMTTGCVVSQVSASCLDVPWGMRDTGMAMSQTIIRDYARSPDMKPDNSVLGWFPDWARFQRRYAFLLALNALAGAYLTIARRRNPAPAAAAQPRVKLRPAPAGDADEAPAGWAETVLLFCGIGGTLLCFWAGPQLRLVAGYIWVLPGLAVVRLKGSVALLLTTLFICAVQYVPGPYAPPAAKYLMLAAIAISLALVWPRSPRALAAALACTAVLGVVPVATTYKLEDPPGDAAVRWLYPPRPEAASTRSEMNPGFNVNFPLQGDRCFAAAIPCTPWHANGLRLLDDKKGLAGGFYAADPWPGAP